MIRTFYANILVHTNFIFFALNFCLDDMEIYRSSAPLDYRNVYESNFKISSFKKSDERWDKSVRTSFPYTLHNSISTEDRINAM